MKLSSSLPLSSSSTTSPPSSPFKKSDPSSSPTTSSRFSYSFLHKQCVKRLKASFTPLRRNSQQKVEINDKENLNTINNNHSENTRNVINQSNRTNNNKNYSNTNNRDTSNKENVFINKINRIIELLPKIFFVILISNIYQFSTAIQDAVDIKVTEYSQEMIQAMTKCSKSYLQNKCMPNERVPALEQACSQWERYPLIYIVTASAETFVMYNVVVKAPHKLAHAEP
ncbi:2548_t:CDS:2 [Entrophospora sp. SA101]|nr:2548_t:CDS:2 [Entrophospora sp. SA101]